MNSSINWHTWLVSFLPHAQQGLSGRFPEPSYLLRSSPLPGSSPPLLASLTPGLLAIPDPSPLPQPSIYSPRSAHCKHQPISTWGLFVFLAATTCLAHAQRRLEAPELTPPEAALNYGLTGNRMINFLIFSLFSWKDSEVCSTEYARASQGH